MKNSKLLKHICNLDLYIGSLSLIILVIVTSTAVFMRYILKHPLLWQEEVQAFCQVWMVFLGGSVAFRTGSIVAIEIVVDALPQKARKIFEYFIDSVVIIVLIFLAIQCRAYLVQVFSKTGRASPILQIPYNVIYGIAPYGCIYMLFSYLCHRHLLSEKDPE